MEGGFSQWWEGWKKMVFKVFFQPKAVWDSMKYSHKLAAGLQGGFASPASPV